jgi:hypothetical protein
MQCNAALYLFRFDQGRLAREDRRHPWQFEIRFQTPSARGGVVSFELSYRQQEFKHGFAQILDMERFVDPALVLWRAVYACTACYAITSEMVPRHWQGVLRTRNGSSSVGVACTCAKNLKVWCGVVYADLLGWLCQSASSMGRAIQN